ncbi:hypothetical protein ACWDRB_41235 [Nonomuraea sp. NPDC003707]
MNAATVNSTTAAMYPRLPRAANTSCREMKNALTATGMTRQVTRTSRFRKI